MDPSLKNINEQVDRLWVKIRDQANKKNFVVRVCYSLPHKRGDVDEVLFLQTREASCSQVLIPMGDFNNSHVYWKSIMAN